MVEVLERALERFLPYFHFFLDKKRNKKIKKKRLLPTNVELIIAFFQGLHTVNKLLFSAVLGVKYFVVCCF
jgi:hypothetical protein